MKPNYKERFNFESSSLLCVELEEKGGSVVYGSMLNC